MGESRGKSRREAELKAAWGRGGVSGVRAAEIDAVLHRERLDGRSKRTHPLASPIADPPDGAMIAPGTDAFLLLHGRPLLWSFEGYRQADDISLGDAVL